MLSDILIHTPKWVFGLLALLVALGAWQMRSRALSLRRSTVLPLALALVLLSLVGVLTTFAHQPVALLAWALGLCAALAALHGRVDTGSVRYDSHARQFRLPGSIWPLVLMLSIFVLKFAVAVALARQPALHQASSFAAAACAGSGALSGAFLARALALWTLVRQAPNAPALGRLH